MNKNVIKWIFFSLVLLLIGGLLYLKFRAHTLIMFDWLRYIKAEDIFKQIKVDRNNTFFNFIVFSLPTGLWLLSAIIIFCILWRENKNVFLLYTLVFSGISMIGEILQLPGIIPGTFDLIDFFTMLTFSIIGVLIYFNYFNRRKV